MEEIVGDYIVQCSAMKHNWYAWSILGRRLWEHYVTQCMRYTYLSL